jgi:hypothetical protein
MEPAKHLFRPAAPRDNLPQLPQTPPRSSLADAMHRFAKNKASVTAVIIIGFLLLFSLLTPLFSHYTVGFRDGFYRTMPPIFAQRRILSGPQAVLDYHTAIGAELGKSFVWGAEEPSGDGEGAKTHCVGFGRTDYTGV